MIYHTIPGTDLKISVMSLGTWVFGGDMWGGAQERECLEAVHAALNGGINLIDTAPIYGSGSAEKLVGQAVKGRRTNILVATKCGLINRGGRIHNDLSGKSILQEINDSLNRLQTDYIDLYQCHWPDPHTPIEETMEVLLTLQRKRKIRYIGVSNFESDLIRRALKIAPIATLQSQYSILDRLIEKDPLPFVRDNGIGVLAYGPLAGGILTGKYQNEKKFPKGDARHFFYQYYTGTKFVATRRLLEKLEKFGRPLNQIAINWVRQQPGVTSVIVGCRNPAQVSQNLEAARWDLSENELKTINDICR